jgi:hypothetical protein
MDETVCSAWRIGTHLCSMSVCSIHALRHSSPRLKTIAASSRAMVGEERKVEGRTGWEGGGLNTSLGERSDTFNELAFRLSRNLQKKNIYFVCLDPSPVRFRKVCCSKSAYLAPTAG